MLHSNIIDMVAGNMTEYTAHMAYDAILSAVVNHVIPDHMRTDSLPAPACLEGSENGFHLILVAMLSVSPGT